MKKEQIGAFKAQYDYEKHATMEMEAGNAEIPSGWSVEKQRAFVQGMAHAFHVIKYHNLTVSDPRVGSNAMDEERRRLEMPFEITSVCRADLVMQGYDRGHVLRLEDGDMKKIADMMSDGYLNAGYWDSLDAMAERYKITKSSE